MKEAILSAFLGNEFLRFSDIESVLGCRSNHLSYHLKQLVADGILIHDGELYSLSKVIESDIPFMSSRDPVLPVVLVLVRDGNSVFLVRRNKRPFLGKLGLPGGRLLRGESLSDAAVRVAGKYGAKVEFESVHSISLEHVTKDDGVLHSFVLFVICAVPLDDLEYTDYRKYENDIISSDLELIKSGFSQRVDVGELVTMG